MKTEEKKIRKYFVKKKIRKSRLKNLEFEI